MGANELTRRKRGKPCNHFTQSFRRSCMQASACVQRLHRGAGASLKSPVDGLWETLGEWK
jgi:hypothetical protein